MICNETGTEPNNSQPTPAPSLQHLHYLLPLPTLAEELKGNLPITMSCVPGPNTLILLTLFAHYLNAFIETSLYTCYKHIKIDPMTLNKDEAQENAHQM